MQKHCEIILTPGRDRRSVLVAKCKRRILFLVENGNSVTAMKKIFFKNYRRLSYGNETK